MTPDERYSRQVRFTPIGLDGQNRIANTRVTLIGGGALGSVSAELLARAGIGFLRIVDRDYVELSNLQRQSLYDEDDVRRNVPKAVAAAAKLRQINSDVKVEPIVDDVNPATVEEYIRDVDLVLDGLDNFETRFVLNDACFKQTRNWIHAAAVGSYGLVMPVFPKRSPCLRCLLGDLPAPGTSPTCDTAGVIAPITHSIASIQVAEALKVIVGTLQPSDAALTSFDVWRHAFHRMGLGAEVMASCPLCNDGRFDYLYVPPLRTVTLCGRNAVQLIPSVKTDLNFSEMAKSMPDAKIHFNEFLLRCQSPPYEVTIFKDGRAIIRGTEEPALARSVYSRLIGV